MPPRHLKRLPTTLMLSAVMCANAAFLGQIASASPAGPTHARTTAAAVGAPLPSETKLSADTSGSAHTPGLHDKYLELRVFTGMGNSSAYREGGGGGAGILRFGGSLLVRRGVMLIGATAEAGTEIIGQGHHHVGALFGVAAAQRGAHLELIGEGGIHDMSGISEELFKSVSGDNSFRTPYVGAQGRVVMDPGAPNGFVVDVGLRARFDLSSEELNLSTCDTGLFSGCETWRDETWIAGGTAIDFSIGLGYQFD